MKILIQNGTVIDPLNKSEPERVADVLIENGKISKIAKNISEVGAEVIDAKNKIVTAGLVDMHVHLREPGREDKETIRTATLAAAHGGITTILGMPNTNPPLDNQTAVKFVLDRAKEEGVVNVFTSGNLTKRGEGKELAEIWEQKITGASMVTDDGHDIQDLGLYRLALEYCRTHDMPILSHAEDESLKRGTHLHEGWVSTQLGIPGSPASTEVVAVARVLVLLEEVPTPYHFTHISTRGAVELIRNAKKKGLPVTCDATPHHLILTDEACLDYNTEAKVNPPLRPEAHRQALLEALCDGTIDAIATDHAPHLLVEKFVEFDAAAVGLVGLETLFPLAYTHLVLRPTLEKSRGLTLPKLIAKLTVNPAKIMRVKKGTLEVGADADLAIFDITTEQKIDKTKFLTKGRNTPFDGWKCRGFATDTIVGGKLVMRDGKVLM